MTGSSFMNRVREVIRLSQFSYSTEKTYLGWIYRYIIFHDKRFPGDMGGREVAQFLTHLAVERKVSAATQNQALNALAFLYKSVLKVPLDEVDFRPARSGRRLRRLNGVVWPAICTIPSPKPSSPPVWWPRSCLRYGSAIPRKPSKVWKNCAISPVARWPRCVPCC